MKIYVVNQSYQDWDGGNSWILNGFKNKYHAEKYKNRLDALRDKVIETYKEYEDWTSFAEEFERVAFIFGVRYNNARSTSFNIQEINVIE